jgi:hypothetical protein
MNLIVQNQSTLINPPPKQIARSILQGRRSANGCKKEKLNNSRKNGTYSTIARKNIPPPIVHHSVGFGDFNIAQLNILILVSVDTVVIVTS